MNAQCVLDCIKIIYLTGKLTREWIECTNEGAKNGCTASACNVCGVRNCSFS